MATAPETSGGAPAARPLRIRHVDSLRAVAAGLVMWAHFKQMLAPLLPTPDPWCLGFLQAMPDAFNLGYIGVFVFFAISGFVICRSFSGPRQGGARRFLIRRVCRLYPAFWVSMLGGLLVCRLIGQPVTWFGWVANATMDAPLFHEWRVLGVYWTLEIELAFYGLCLVLYLAGCLERRAVLLGLVAVFAWLPRLLRLLGRARGVPIDLTQDQYILSLGLAVMCWGLLFRLAYDETGGFRRAGWWRCRGVWLVVAGLLALIDLPDPRVKLFLLGLRPGPAPSHLTIVCALVIFTVWVAWLRIDNRVLTYLGVISYSLYLFHPVPKYVAAALLASGGCRLPFWTVLPLCAAATVALAAGVYRWVEWPAIALGKRRVASMQSRLAASQISASPSSAA